jgi:hypothetical protein
MAFCSVHGELGMRLGGASSPAGKVWPSGTTAVASIITPPAACVTNHYQPFCQIADRKLFRNEIRTPMSTRCQSCSMVQALASIGD